MRSFSTVNNRVSGVIGGICAVVGSVISVRLNVLLVELVEIEVPSASTKLSGLPAELVVEAGSIETCPVRPTMGFTPEIPYRISGAKILVAGFVATWLNESRRYNV